ncbi:hypothetical protein NIE88_21765 [Sporolactobacillus shoreicorticis]|uniref:Uncharacterized protein n=1 Tax=Sporolactobacillus shoreicorticis TaxID=1923877 RepID=A0ABW5S9H3_9BACL|nr:hypothetical protein [Sporolactobacillus shoreicorticis]MCO7128353.1 hypothetical protein [Sporolactobacillus shoreicorticis]
MNINWQSFQGTVTMISDFTIGPSEEGQGCYQLFTLENSHSIVNFVVSPTTYFVDHARIAIGDRVTGYYDGNVPVPLIYPPQYRALIMVQANPDHNVKVDFFNDQLVSSDGQLSLTLTPFTQIFLPNGQYFTHNPANRNLIVIYGPATKSIPTQTTPYKMIVWC